ncbi:quinone oxidoreductase family protein [Nakamurella aerolata]|uniref:Quinone oxidoreductase n=1 Tax=Nakamurella aerolata TaxID=1656892 RepID=A0A849A2D3_9ACTN|nr:quinone oxidoreductase [Nakamurella aerolata]NNG34715.1 quinone oxidoreductase [Nakamurella aerolata]
MSAADTQQVNAIQYSRTGGPDVLQYTQVPLPAPRSGEVTVDIAAAGVNFIDIYQREGRYPMQLPAVAGSEGAGTVQAVGPDVTGVRVGDRVAWESLPGSYADAVTGPADRLVAVPEHVELKQAAAVPLQGFTAHYLARDSYRIQPGDTVLIHAGAGGVGLLLTQIAKILGATVISTVSTADKAELSSRAGADHVIVGYQNIPGTVRDLTDGTGVAAVYDGVGQATFDDSLASLATRGTLVLFGAASGPVAPVDPQRLNAAGSLFLTRPTLKDHVASRDELLRRADEVFGWIADGRLTVSIGAEYPLPDAARAQDDLAARRTTGKLLLIPEH